MRWMTTSRVMKGWPHSHWRTATTPTDLLIEDDMPGLPPNMLLADCSCGGWYLAPVGGDEYAALSRARTAHVRTARAVQLLGIRVGGESGVQ